MGRRSVIEFTLATAHRLLWQELRRHSRVFRNMPHRLTPSLFNLARTTLGACLLLVTTNTPDASAQTCGRSDGKAQTSTVSDALAALRAAVGIPGACSACRCDVDGNAGVSVGDAFRILQKSVGRDVAFDCQPCACSIPVRIRVPGNPRGIVLTDIDEDGREDMVTVSDAAASVIVRRSIGTHEDADVRAHDPRHSPLGVSVVDVDQDGSLDIVTAGVKPSSVSILRGDGEGGFVATTLLRGGDAPILATAADLDGDGNHEVIAADSTANQVLIWTNTEAGFGDATSLAVGTGPRWISVVDLNGDERPEILTANRDSGDLTLLANNGDGSFAGPKTLPLRAGAHEIFVTELNDDDTPDLVVAYKSGRGVAVLLGDGSGGFDEPSIHTTGEPAMGVDVGDANGDGNADILLSTGYGPPEKRLAFLPGLGDGDFGDPVFSPASYRSRMVRLHDWNEDGLLDAIVVSPSSDAVEVRSGSGDGSFVSNAGIAQARSSVRDAVAADFNGDGNTDYATVNWHVGCFVYQNDGSASFTETQLAGPLHYASEIAVAELTGDGVPDLLILNNKVPTDVPNKRCSDPHLALRPGLGDGSFAAEQRIPEADVDKFAHEVFTTGDLNNDGRDDIVVRERGGEALRVLLSSGDAGGFDLSDQVNTEAPASHPRLADFNRDGNLDLAYIVGAEIQLRKGNGEGAFGTIALRIQSTFELKSFLLGDLNGDAIPDLLANLSGASDRIDIRLMQPSFAAPVHASAPILAPLDKAYLEDLNRDGALDLFTTTLRSGATSQHEINVSFGDGRGSFEGPRPFTFITPDSRGYSRVQEVVAADFDNSGTVDLLPLFPSERLRLMPVLKDLGHCLR